MAFKANPSRRWSLLWRSLVGASLLLFVTGCELSKSGGGQIRVRVEADGRAQTVVVPTGSTVAEALEVAGLSLGSLDRSEPAAYVLLEPGAEIQLVRVSEQFRTEQESIPFTRQQLRNDSLPEGEERLVQAGINGQQELTHRFILEDGVQISDAVIKTVVLSTPVAEIVMVGSRASVSPLAIPGRLVYLSAGNAWVMETTTANRRLLVNTADLDGRVLQLSPDSKYLLYTRRSTKAPELEINTLWAVAVDSEAKSGTSLGAANIIHFADWYPDAPGKIAYSAVEPRPNAPGWQANNDLYKAGLDGKGIRILDAQSGGIYGWWGTSFAFAPNGRLAYTRPDGLGLVSQDGGYLAPLVDMLPLQTRADWAWSPGISWGSDSQALYYVDHVPGTGTEPSQESSRFDLKALSLSSNSTVTLAEDVGMFAFPSVSPRIAAGAARAYQIAFLQAIFPERSDVSRYRLQVVDRDGSNRRQLFPSSDLPGLEPQRAVWAPGEIPGQSGPTICILYQGNLWLVDSGNGQARQITGDGLVSGVDWK